MLKRYAKVTVLILMIVVLATEGYFVYLFYQNPQNFPILGDGASNVASATADDAAVEEANSRTSVTAVVHQATSANTVDNSTYIDNPLLNNNPDAVVLATQVWDQDKGAGGDAHPIGVWYDANRSGKWAIFNQDLAAMPEDATFNVTFSEGPGKAVFVNRATSANTAGNIIYIDHPLANNNPDAVLSVTPNWNPGGDGGIYNAHPVGVQYDDAEGKWVILNQDLAQIPKNAAFDVAVSDGTTPAK